MFITFCGSTNNEIEYFNNFQFLKAHLLLEEAYFDGYTDTIKKEVNNILKVVCKEGDIIKFDLNSHFRKTEYNDLELKFTCKGYVKGKRRNAKIVRNPDEYTGDYFAFGTAVLPKTTNKALLDIINRNERFSPLIQFEKVPGKDVCYEITNQLGIKFYCKILEIERSEIIEPENVITDEEAKEILKKMKEGTSLNE